MTTYIWTIDTPWAKKGELVADTTNTKQVMPSHKDIINRLLVIGWIKPVEEEPQEKKLTEEEILEAITVCVHENDYEYREFDHWKLAKFLAEHLK